MTTDMRTDTATTNGMQNKLKDSETEALEKALKINREKPTKLTSYAVREVVADPPTREKPKRGSLPLIYKTARDGYDDL
jgi:hypothetical protein